MAGREPVCGGSHAGAAAGLSERCAGSVRSRYAAQEAGVDDPTSEMCSGECTPFRTRPFAMRKTQMKYLLSILCAFITVFSAFAQASLKTTNTPPSAVVLDDFRLIADLASNAAAFTLTATAKVENPKGGSIELLSGMVALTDVGPHPKWHVNAESNRFILVFERGGKYPIRLKFNAAMREHEGWRSVDFHVAPSALQPITLQGLPADTQFDFPGGARPERRDNNFASFLPPDGSVKLSWKQAPSETEGKLFYSAEMMSQISVGPVLMRQIALLNFKVMQ